MMTKEQYKKANSTVYPVLMVILGYFILTLIAHLLSVGAAWKVMVQLGTDIVAVIVSTVMFLVRKETKMCSLVMLASGAVAYTIIVLFNSSDISFIYAFAILFASMAFLNARLIIAGNAVIIVSNLLRIVFIYDMSQGAA